MSVKIKILTAVYVLILAGIIFVADTKSTRYVLGFIGNIPYGDKIGHFCLMGFFSFLLNLSFDARSEGFGKVCYLTGSLIVLLVVTLEEFSQLFIRGRSFELEDLAFDYAGIFLFGELARFICRKWQTKKS